MDNTDKHRIELASLRAVMPKPLDHLRDDENAVPFLDEMRGAGDDDRRRYLNRTHQSVCCPLLSSKFQPRRSPVSHETGDEEFYVSK